MKWSLLITLMFTSSVFLAQESINQVDDKGRKQGLWVKKYENGEERYRGTFKDDKPVGTFFNYDEEGIKQSELTYIGEDGVEADAVFFHKNSTIMGKGKYVNRKKEGTWKYYDDETVLSSIEQYKNGLLTGTSKIYFLSGQLAAEIPYVEGLKTGPFKEYFADGKIRMMGTYQDNTYTGDYIQNFPSGEPMIKGQYKAAVKDGLWIYYADDGKIKAQQVYEKGKLINEKIEEGFVTEDVPIDIEEKDKIEESELLDEFYKQNEDGR